MKGVRPEDRVGSEKRTAFLALRGVLVGIDG